MIHVADPPQKAPFRPLFRPFYPHPARASSLRAEERKVPPTFCHLGNLVGPQRPRGYCSPATRHSPLATRHSPLASRPSSGVRSCADPPRRLLPSTDRRIAKK